MGPNGFSAVGSLFSDRLLTSILLMLVMQPLTVFADAIMVSRAMFASTIAEYFVEEDHVRVELEIGVEDLPSFRNLLPGAIFEKMGYAPEPVDERLELFFSRDFAIYSNGKPLKGHITSMSPETRVKRDPVTGEPLPEDSEEPEMVIAVTLMFPFENRPDALTFGAPTVTGLASVGFIVYHRGVPILRRWQALFMLNLSRYARRSSSGPPMCSAVSTSDWVIPT